MRLEQSLREDFDITHSKLVLFGPAATGIIANRFVSCMDAKDAGLGGFDSLLVAHVLEHLDAETARDLLATYLPYVREGGRAIVITPQQAGFRSDATHVRYVDPVVTAALLAEIRSGSTLDDAVGQVAASLPVDPDDLRIVGLTLVLELARLGYLRPEGI